jgi:hypothetical protein
MLVRLCMASMIVTLMVGTQDAVAEPMEFRCQFERYASLGGNQFDATNVEVRETDMTLIFIVDPEAGHSYMVGNLGTVEVRAQVVDGTGIVFIEPVPNGTVQVTAIDENGNAVHSRHTVMFGELVPQQFYGHCQ